MIQSFVTLDHGTHTYTDTNGKVYTSVSKVLDSVEDKFDEEGMSRKCAGRGNYVNMTPAQVKAQWKATAKESTDHGTRIHNAIEDYSKSFELDEKRSDLLPLVKSIAEMHSGYVRTYDECTLYHPEYFIAGTTDRLLQPTSRSGYLDICDWKTNVKKGIYYFSDYGKYKKFPVEHLSDCNYNRYALQMSMYGIMTEILTGKKIRALNIVYIPPDDFMKYKVIPCPYMKSDALSIMKHFVSERDKKSNFISVKSTEEYEEPIF